MTWALSRFRAGDVVEVRSKEEILATLDAQGCVDDLPFMPEMLQFCGQRIPVRAVAHKTCETAMKTWQGRRLDETVHLANLRCDGSAHGGCEADCTLFWKDAWLKPANGEVVAGPQRDAPGCSEAELLALTRSQLASDDAPRFACQATQLYDATAPLRWWDPRQYVFDITSGNHSLTRVLRVTWLSALRRLLESVESIKYVRWFVRRFSEWMHRLMTGREIPSLFRSAPPCKKTPTGRLGLEPGETVRIKSKTEIEKTLDRYAKNRGLSFDPEEMAPYCGGTYRVRRSVTRLLDEETGEMREMKEPCIILETVVCKAEYARCRLNCPRQFYAFWRELWLERVETR